MGINTLGEFIVRHRLACAISLMVVTVLLGWRALLLKEDLSFETLYPSRCPEKEFSDQFTKSFGNVNEIVAVAITGGNLFSPEFLKALSRMTRRLEKLEHVSVVYSLASVPYVQGTEDGFDVRDFLVKLPTTEAESRQMEERARAFSLYKGRLLSEDGKYTAVYVQMDDVVGKPCDPQVAELLGQLGGGDPDARQSAAASLTQMSDRAKKAFTGGDPRLAAWVGQLGSPDSAVREGAIRGLASAGPGSLRTLGVPDRRELIGRIETIVEEDIPPGYRTFVTGLNVVERDYSRIIKKDKIIFQTLVVVVLALCFFLSFRSWRDTVMALISLGLSAVCSMGAVELVGGVIDIVNSVIFLMVLVVGTSNIIHMTNSFYKHWSPEDGHEAGCRAAARMVSSVGLACLMASLTTACGFGSLYSARIGTIMHFGINMAVAVMVTYLVSQVSMPLMLSLIRELPRSRRGDAGISRMDRLSEAISALVTQHWRRVMGLCALAVAVLFLGVFRLEVDTLAVGELPERSPTIQNIHAMENLAGSIGFEVSVKSTGSGTVIQPDVLRKVDRIVRYLREQPETIRTWSLADYVKTMNRAADGGKDGQFAIPDSDAAVDQFLLLYSFSQKGVREMKGLISQDRKGLRIVSRVHDVGAKPYLRLRDRVENMGKELFPGGDVEVRVTSNMYLLHMAMNNMSNDMMSSMAWAFVFVGILMGFALRSLRLGLVAIPPNIAPLLATLGFMGFTGIALRVGTLVVFSVGLGIAVDNTIHYLLSYRQARGDCSSYAECTRRTYRKVADSMILSSVILMAGFLCTLFATFKSIWQMGVLCAFTVLVALLADLLMTPLLVRFVERSTSSSREVVPDSLSDVEGNIAEETP